MTQMEDIDHTNPYTDDPFVETYRRGPVVAADGGEPDAVEDVGVEVPSEQEDPDTMADVAHDSPNEGTNRTFERGREGRDESV